MKLSGFEKKKEKKMKISTFCYILIVSLPFIVPIFFSSPAGVYYFAVWIAVVVCTILYSLAVILEKLEKIENDTHGKWIPISEGLPECEQEVLICTEKRILGKDAYIDSIVTPAIYEDGTMLEVNSIWHWEDIDFTDWDDTEDCGIIPKGWFENRHFNPDDVYNNPVDRKVVAWMPLPDPYKESEE